MQYMNVGDCDADGNDHTSLTAPLPVCSAKLSKLGLGQYYGGVSIQSITHMAPRHQEYNKLL